MPNGWPCQCGKTMWRRVVFPQEPHKPMYPQEKMYDMVRYIESIPEPMIPSTRSLESAREIAAFYENLITHGELIRRDELLKWLGQWQADAEAAGVNPPVPGYGHYVNGAKEVIGSILRYINETRNQ